MISAEQLTLKSRAARALADPFLRKAVRFTVERLRNGKAQSTAALGNWEEWRERGRALRAHVVRHLDHYLEEFARNVEARGQRVYFAADAAEAVEIVRGIVRERRAKLVVKSKSMVSEEVHVNRALEREGVESLETDLGEWIVQLARETPSHLIIPAIHKDRHQIQALFEGEGAARLSPETKVLAGHARKRLRERFAAAEIGMTGCNFAVAETGSVVLFTNEGNGRMVTTLPKTHIVLMGMERIVPTLADVELMANLLPRSATGQKLTTYVNILSGARAASEADGARELHVVIVDNGRSRQLGDPEFQEVLHCIRCGACLNVCPVYRQLGGHAYGSVYSGPIGAVLTPLLRENSERARELADASTLCGACFEACPVKIPLHDMLVRLRRRNVAQKDGSTLERVAFAVFAVAFSHALLYRMLAPIGRWLQRRLASGRLGWLVRHVPALDGWLRHRTLPAPEGGTFRSRFRDLAG